ncbi:MAG TPA: tRNA (adenosine(37)-N6)-dimethylallyltransferase MiaA [Methylophilaceae bacterium]|nr:tRNA (adenosine(37)-N6)-dimethylallyltransferase MiaA [Methylophilaceae bacterium]HAJ72956.1 tRNA (adenosine(37)-N6)-dimethylallyltransferase MiaA [Methylophilaceae bacterium]
MTVATQKYPPAIFLMGPTASGKTRLAVSLFQTLPVELISVDSALVFKGMNIGTAKPDANTLAIAPHHLIDIRLPTQPYSAASFRADALRLMADITSRGKVPLLVGGTMLYFKTLESGLSELPEADQAIRATLDAEAAAVGWPAMHAKLAKVDPETAIRLRPNDMQRIQRALEVYRLTGKTMSQHYAEQESHAFPYHVLKVALIPSDRKVLHERIALRFKQMLEMGLREEVQALMKLYPELTISSTAMRCVGYRQVLEYLQGDFGIDDLCDRGIFATRQLAKRQLTWLRGMQDIQVIDCLAPDLDIQTFNIINQYIKLNT